MLHNNTSVASRSRFGKTGLCGGAFTRSLQSPRVAEACWGVNLICSNSLGTVRLSHTRLTAESSRVETFRFRFVIFHSCTRRKQVLFLTPAVAGGTAKQKLLRTIKKTELVVLQQLLSTESQKKSQYNSQSLLGTFFVIILWSFLLHFKMSWMNENKAQKLRIKTSVGKCHPSFTDQLDVT